MKRIALILALAFSACSFAACGGNGDADKTDTPVISSTPAQQTSTPESTEDIIDTSEPSPTPDDGIKTGDASGQLTDEEVQEILDGASSVQLEDSDTEVLTRIGTDMQPLMDAFTSLSAPISNPDMENEEWVTQITEAATTLEQACDTAMQADYGEKFADLKKLFDAGYDAFKQSAASIKDSVASKDLTTFMDAANWLQVGAQYLDHGNTYLITISSNTTDGGAPAETAPATSAPAE